MIDLFTHLFFAAAIIITALANLRLAEHVKTLRDRVNQLEGRR